ncbi:unnamed protein product [Trichogramma brassicae]|uniref:UNC93-like protein n=1 Tax=Trichogramma brassicae TaxID=86971 RepID=A0A6H5ISZ1_9HYME|nr:unnamed protein product [Trichogramma brassicae]
MSSNVSLGSSGYRNRGFKRDDEQLPAALHEMPPEPQKPPQLPDDDGQSSRKFKLSRSEKWRILKNIGTVSVAFMVQFTAFQGTANLQSSINASDGLGTVSLSAIYAALVLSCIFVPTFLIKRLTVKWTLCLSMLCYAPYIGSQFYPRFYTLVPAGVLLGLGAAPMWAAKATYLTQVGGVYAKLTDEPADAIVVRFFGFFFLAWQTAELWGNLISSLVLSEGEFKEIGSNVTATAAKVSRCGANFCIIGNGGHENLHRPPDSEIYEISAIYLTCVFVAVLIVALFVDPLSRYGEKQHRNDSKPLSGIQLLSATAYQLKKPYQQLLIPITVWIGMEQAFIGAEFTQEFSFSLATEHTARTLAKCTRDCDGSLAILSPTLVNQSISAVMSKRASQVKKKIASCSARGGNFVVVYVRTYVRTYSVTQIRYTLYTVYLQAYNYSMRAAVPSLPRVIDARATHSRLAAAVRVYARAARLIWISDNFPED